MNTNYPIRYASMPVYSNQGELNGYITMECFLVQEVKTYFSDNNIIKTYKVVFRKNYLNLLNKIDREETPWYNYKDKTFYNADSVDEIFERFSEAQENTKRLNQDFMNHKLATCVYDSKEYHATLANLTALIGEYNKFEVNEMVRKLVDKEY